MIRLIFGILLVICGFTGYTSAISWWQEGVGLLQGVFGGFIVGMMAARLICEGVTLW
jgi:hypothetical protein